MELETYERLLKKAFLFGSGSRHGAARPEPVQTAVNQGNELIDKTLDDIKKNPAQTQSLIDNTNRTINKTISRQLSPGEFVDMIGEIQNPTMLGSKPLMGVKPITKVSPWDPKSNQLPERAVSQPMDLPYNPNISTYVTRSFQKNLEPPVELTPQLRGLPLFEGQKKVPTFDLDANNPNFEADLDSFNRSVVGASKPNAYLSEATGEAKPLQGSESPGESKPDIRESWFRRYRVPLLGAGAAAAGFALYKYLLDKDEKKKSVKR